MSTNTNHKQDLVRVELVPMRKGEFPARAFPEFTLDHGQVWTADLTEAEARRVRRLAGRRHVFCHIYDMRYVRSDNYRQRFIRAFPPKHGKYRCVYCGRWVKTRDMTVDHVIPVYGVKRSHFMRWKIRHYTDINDLRNLVPSCRRCNLKKGESTSFVWRWRARLGKHALYWRIRRVTLFLLLMLLILACLPGDVGNTVRAFLLQAGTAILSQLRYLLAPPLPGA